MTIKKLAIASLLTLTALTGTAFARPKKTPPPQTHHCKLADGTTDAGKTKKQCLAAKGTWAKDAPAAAATPDAPPATK